MLMTACNIEHLLGNDQSAQAFVGVLVEYFCQLWVGCKHPKDKDCQAAARETAAKAQDKRARTASAYKHNACQCHSSCDQGTKCICFSCLPRRHGCD